MKRAITIIMLIALTLPSFAQFETSKSRSRYNRDDTERYYGLRLGMNIASTSSDSIPIHVQDWSSEESLACNLHVIHPFGLNSV